jgi:hypothetical protein
MLMMIGRQDYITVSDNDERLSIGHTCDLC